MLLLCCHHSLWIRARTRDKSFARTCCHLHRKQRQKDCGKGCIISRKKSFSHSQWVWRAVEPGKKEEASTKKESEGWNDDHQVFEWRQETRHDGKGFTRILACEHVLGVKGSMKFWPFNDLKIHISCSYSSCLHVTSLVVHSLLLIHEPNSIQELEAIELNEFSG